MNTDFASVLHTCLLSSDDLNGPKLTFISVPETDFIWSLLGPGAIHCEAAGGDYVTRLLAYCIP